MFLLSVHLSNVPIVAFENCYVDPEVVASFTEDRPVLRGTTLETCNTRTYIRISHWRLGGKKMENSPPSRRVTGRNKQQIQTNDLSFSRHYHKTP
jgi:hypothetical protein